MSTVSAVRTEKIWVWSKVIKKQNVILDLEGLQVEFQQAKDIQVRVNDVSKVKRWEAL